MSSLAGRNIRHDFPILAERVQGHPLTYLDNGATTQKPTAVINAVDAYYRHDNANVHRGVHWLSERATLGFNAVRDKAAAFINAPDSAEIVFVRGATEAINLVAHCFGEARVQLGDEVVITAMEHHSNIVPWQWLCQRKGAVLRVVPVTEDGCLDEATYGNLLCAKTRLVAFTHVSNVLGTVNPVARMTDAAHAVGAAVLIDGAQAGPRLTIDVQAIGCDFYVLSGHKMYAPTGIGFLYAKSPWLTELPPYHGGGSMVEQVTLTEANYLPPPYKFEAGTPNIAGTIGLGAAIDYVQQFAMADLQAHERALTQQLTDALAQRPEIRLLPAPSDALGMVSFTVQGVHPHDVGTVLNSVGVAVRAGHHCAMPILQHFGVSSAIRASFAIYNDTTDIEALLRGLDAVQRLFSP